MFNDLLLNLNAMFAECSDLLAGVVRKKEGRIFKKKFFLPLFGWLLRLRLCF